MDSKWGGLIVAALAGVGLVCFINRQPHKRVMEGESIEPQIDEDLKPDEESLDKRPQLDDFVEMNVAKMVEHLKWLQRHPQFNTRNMKVDLLLNDPKHGLQGVLDSYNEKREKDKERAYPLLKFNNYTVYADKYGKCPDGYTPEGDGWVTGKCFKILEDGTKEEWKGEKAIGSKGPLNKFFQKSGYLKHDTPMAMQLARETLHETGKYYKKDEDSGWEGKDPLEKLRAQYYDREIQEELMDKQTLDEYAHWLWDEQFTKNNRKDLRTQGFLMPFDIDTCRKWLEYLYVEHTYQGYVMEEKAIDKMNYSYEQQPHTLHPYPIYRYAQEIGEPFKIMKMGSRAKTVNMYNKIVATFTGKIMDANNKVDLLVRPKGKDDIVLAGVQVKPLSFFSKEDLLEEMQNKHRIIGGKEDARYLMTKTQKKSNGRPAIDSFPDKNGSKKRVKSKGNFNVQTLVYDEYSKEFLNYEAVLLRIQANLPDPILTDIPEWKDKGDIQGRTVMRDFFINQKREENEIISEKCSEYLASYAGFQKAIPSHQSHINEKERQARHQKRMIAQQKERDKQKKQKIYDERKKQRERKAKTERDRKRGPKNPFGHQSKSHKKKKRRHY